MKRWAILMAVVMVVAVSIPALAGEGHCKGTADECCKKMATKLEHKAWLGIEMDHNEDGRYVVTSVVPGSPAEAAGFQSGDVLLALNGVEWSKQNHDAVKKASYELKPGSSATYVVKRGGEKLKLSATLAHVPREVMAQWVGEHMLAEHADVKMASK